MLLRSGATIGVCRGIREGRALVPSRANKRGAYSGVLPRAYSCSILPQLPARPVVLDTLTCLPRLRCSTGRYFCSCGIFLAEYTQASQLPA